MGIKYIDAKRLRRVLVGGGKWIQKHESYLNELNVYPVPDGDTGSNMSLTVEAMIKEIEEHTDNKTSMKELVDLVEEAVLIGARGNSGTILSQIIASFLKSVENKKRLLAVDVAEALKASKELAYTVVNNPVEGTILTVIRKVADKAEEIKDYEFFNDFIEKLIESADEAVKETPDLLPKLKEAGVVDSGAMGLYYFFVGMGKTLTELNLFTGNVVESEFDKVVLNIDHNIDDIKHKYCTEFIISIADFDVEDFKNELLKLGDSAVFVKSTKKFKTHIHTNTPGDVLNLASNLGDLEKIKIENMKLQNEGIIQNEKNIAKIFVNSKSRRMKKEAYIILADTEELKDEFLKMGAEVVILGGQSKNPSVSDILSAIQKISDDRTIYLLPNNKNVIATANLASERVDKNIIVIPTKTMLEGMFYLQYPNDTLKQKNQRNLFNESIEITKAVRNTKSDGIEIKEGDYLLLVNTKIQYADAKLSNIIDKIIKEYITDNTLAITIVEGVNKHKEETEKLLGITKNLTSPVKLISATQDNYDYYIFIENKDPKLPEIAIITDTAADLDPREIEGLPISLIPIRMECEGVTYRDGIDIQKEDFWKMILENKEFKTSQPSPKEITNLYQELFRKGYKKIIAIPLSSKMSGTINVLKLARDMVKRENDIKIYDSKAISILQGYMVKQAAIKSLKGENLSNIVYLLDNIVNKCKLYIVIDTLKYLYQGGRISKTAQTIGDFLNLKPIITVSDGALIVEKKVFGGDNAAIKYIEKYINDYSKTHSIYAELGSSSTEKQKEHINRVIQDIKDNRKVSIVKPIKTIGSTVGTHAGPVWGVLVIPKLL